MTHAEVLERVSATLSEMFGLDPAQISPDARLYEDLDLDSIDAIDMAAKLQEMTGRRLGEDDLKAMRTVGDVAQVVEKLLAERSDSTTA